MNFDFIGSIHERMEMLQCYSAARLYLHYIQSVTAVGTVPSSSLHVCPHTWQRACCFSLTDGGALGERG